MAYSPEVKSRVLAALMAGQSVTDAAKQFRVSKSRVSEWKSELTRQEIEQIRTTKKERLIDLIESHLTASLKGATKVAQQADNDNWLNKQSADQLAIFYGVLSDKAFRLVEVAGRVFNDSERQAA
jgi:transposase